MNATEWALETFRKYGIEANLNNEGKIIISHYSQPKEGTFEELGIDEDKLIENVAACSGKFDTRTGLVENVGDRMSLVRNFVDVPFESEESFAYIMLPQSLESNKMDIEIYLLLNDSEVKYTTPITPSTNGQFEGGKKYTYNITVKNTGITIEDAFIYPWENGDSGDLDADIAL